MERKRSVWELIAKEFVKSGFAFNAVQIVVKGP